MEFDRRRRSSALPNLTPLIDVVFLLLVFFMLTAHFVHQEAVIVDLPAAATGADVKGDEALTVTVDADGRIAVNGQAVPRAALADTLKPLLAGRDDKSVTIAGDELATLGVAISLLDAARNAGAEKVNLLTEQP